MYLVTDNVTDKYSYNTLDALDIDIDSLKLRFYSDSINFYYYCSIYVVILVFIITDVSLIYPHLFYLSLEEVGRPMDSSITPSVRKFVSQGISGNSTSDYFETSNDGKNFPSRCINIYLKIT